MNRLPTPSATSGTMCHLMLTLRLQFDDIPFALALTPAANPLQITHWEICRRHPELISSNDVCQWEWRSVLRAKRRKLSLYVDRSCQFQHLLFSENNAIACGHELFYVRSDMLKWNNDILTPAGEYQIWISTSPLCAHKSTELFDFSRLLWGRDITLRLGQAFVH